MSQLQILADKTNIFVPRKMHAECSTLYITLYSTLYIVHSSVCMTNHLFFCYYSISSYSGKLLVKTVPGLFWNFPDILESKTKRRIWIRANEGCLIGNCWNVVYSRHYCMLTHASTLTLPSSIDGPAE